jgi:hypothetical protein
MWIINKSYDNSIFFHLVIYFIMFILILSEIIILFILT